MYKDLASLCGGGEEGSCHKVGTEKMINLDCQHSWGGWFIRTRSLGVSLGFLQTPATPRDQQPAPSYYMHHVIYRFLWSVKMSVTATNFFNEGCQERSKKILIHHLNIKISFKFNTKLSKLISYFWDFTSQLMHVFFFILPYLGLRLFPEFWLVGSTYRVHCSEVPGHTVDWQGILRGCFIVVNLLQLKECQCVII